MTNPDHIAADDAFINSLADLPAAEQSTAIFDYSADTCWQAAPANDTDGRAR